LAATGQVNYSADFAAVEIAAPADQTVDDIVPLLQIKSEPLVGSWEEAVCRNRKEAFKRGDGPRNFFTYRDVGATALTDGRIKIHDGEETGLGTVEVPAGGTGWHNHTMSQFFMVLNGEEVIEVEGYGKIRMVAGDAMTLGAGMRHNVSALTADFSAFEMCLPAEYETTPQSAP
jgi:quercetin dioxygenase-like cupin family protein